MNEEDIKLSKWDLRNDTIKRLLQVAIYITTTVLLCIGEPDIIDGILIWLMRH